MYGRNLKAYQRTNLEAELSVADPHRIVQMMFEGLLERLAQAKGAILRKDYEYKANRVAKAVGIVNGLQASLDRRQDPELYDRMYALYDYIRDLINDASAKLTTEPLDEAIKLILPIKQAWDSIPPEARAEAYARKQGQAG